MRVKAHHSSATAGSIFTMLFGAVAIVGILAVSVNTLIRGPVTSMSEITRHTIAENSMIASSRLAIALSPSLQALAGDCDADGYIEPFPYRDAGASPKPAGGGYLPATIGASLSDPWGTEYGYCVWDHGAKTITDAVIACGGASPRRLKGSPATIHPVIAVISAGKDRTFQTSCNAFVDANADGVADTPLVNKPAGSNDIVLAYNYAEAVDMGGGESLWRDKNATTADINRDVEVRSSTDAVTARIERETGMGLFNSLYTNNIHRRDATNINVNDVMKHNANIDLGTAAAIVGASGTVLDANGGWVRTYGTAGWYNGTYAGGWHMSDGTWLRSYGNKPIMTSAWNDADNPNVYYVDPNNGSVLENLSVNIMYDRYNTGYYIQPRATSSVNQLYIQDGRANIIYDMYSPGYYIQPRAASILNDLRAIIYYDQSNTGYYMQPHATSSFNVVYAYAFYYHSDERKKKNIETIKEDQVDKLYNLRGVNFDWKENDKHDIGFIAQEVQKVFPELVSEMKEGELGVQYGNLIPLMIEAAKKQKTEISTLSKKIADQETRLAALEARFQKIPPLSIVPRPVPPVAPVSTKTTPSPSTQQLDLAQIAYATDISLCKKANVPACLGKEGLGQSEIFTCKAEMAAYIYSAKIYYLCARNDAIAEEDMRMHYETAIKKATERKFDLNDTDLKNIGISHVMALEKMLDGSAAAPSPLAPDASTANIPPPLLPVAPVATDKTVPQTAVKKIGPVAQNKVSMPVLEVPAPVTAQKSPAPAANSIAQPEPKKKAIEKEQPAAALDIPYPLIAAIAGLIAIFWLLLVVMRTQKRK